MSSIEELSVIRLYRAYNTVIQMCMDRGLSVRHPSVVVQAIRDPSLYSDEDGLDYNWFLRNFVMQQNADSGPQCVPLRNAMRLVCTAPIGEGQEGHEEKISKEEEEEEKEKDEEEEKEKERRTVLVFFAAPALTSHELHGFHTKARQKKARGMIIVSAGRIAPGVRREAREMSGRLRPGTSEELLTLQLFEEDALAFNIARHETVPPHEPLSVSATQELLRSRQLQLSQIPRILEADPMVAYCGLPRGCAVRVRRYAKETGPFDMYRQVI